jgi:hypothetical protein
VTLIFRESDTSAAGSAAHWIEEGRQYMVLVVTILAGVRYIPVWSPTLDAEAAPVGPQFDFMTTREAAEAACQIHADRAEATAAARAADAAYKEARAAAEAAEEALDAALDALRACGGSVQDLI